jgi:hypothetical protein
MRPIEEAAPVATPLDWHPFLLSQHDPVAKLGIDREKLRAVLAFVWHGNVDRMERDFAALEAKK